MDHGLAERLEEGEEAFREVEAQLADPAADRSPPGMRSWVDVMPSWARSWISSSSGGER